MKGWVEMSMGHVLQQVLLQGKDPFGDIKRTGTEVDVGEDLGEAV